MRIDGTDLAQWAERLDCRAYLPEFLRRLVHTTVPKLGRVDFPAGEGVQKPGFDGYVEAAVGTAFVPLGVSVWEVSANKDPLAKAKLDFDKRSAQPPRGVDAKTTSYVFVTPRRWAGAKDWAAEATARGIWADVRAYDADTLEQWLELAPAPGAWLAERLGRASDLRALQDHWLEWSIQTVPPTAEELVLAGREQVEEAIHAWLAREATCLKVRASEPDEVVATLFAILRRIPPGIRDRTLDRAIVVQNDDTLRRMARDGRRLIVVAMHCRPEVAQIAARAGNHVLLASSGTTRGESIDLGSLDMARAYAVLEQRMGVPSEKALRLVQDSRGDLRTIRRGLGATEEELSSELATLLLLGGWDETRAVDRDAAARVAGRSEAEVRELVRRWSTGTDPVFELRGGVRTWSARRDAWQRGVRHLSVADLQRFREVVLDVLSIPDPRFELPPDQQWAAAIHGKVLPHSAALRAGLVDTIALIAMESGGASENWDGQVEASSIVATLLRGWKSWEQWATMDEHLPTLAEAAPSCFLRTVQQLVERDPSLILRLLGSDPLDSAQSTSRSGLIWSLEVLAWSEDFLGFSAELLAALAKIDDSSKNPRALNSLREIFLPWRPNTVAGRDVRLGVLRSLFRKNSDVGFRLALELLPDPLGEACFGTYEARWRPWRRPSGSEIDVTWMHQVHDAAGADLLQLALAEPARWAEVIPKLDALSPDRQTEAIVALESLDPANLDEPQQLALHNALLATLRRHRKFPEIPWAIDENQLVRLEHIGSRLDVRDGRPEYVRLFAQLPELAGFDPRESFDDYQEALHAARLDSTRRLAKDLDPEALVAAAEDVEDPYGLGYALGQMDDVLEALFRATARCPSSEAQTKFRGGLGAALYQRSPSRYLEIIGALGIVPALRAEFALWLPYCESTWNLVAEWGPEVKLEYWRSVRPRMPATGEELRLVLGELCSVGRALAALDLAGAATHLKQGALTPELVVAIFDASATAITEGRTSDDLHMFEHHVSRLLRWLQNANGEWQAQRRRLEWHWLPVYSHGRYKPEGLFDWLAEDPDFFVEILCTIYRSEREPPADSTIPRDRDRARQSSWLLQHWRRLPGSRPDGTVDAEHLEWWFSTARKHVHERGRGRIGDQKIGAVLASAPVGDDSRWPHESVREIFEKAADSSDIEVGFSIGRKNRQGPMWMSGEAGAAQRQVAEKFREDALALRARCPTTARMLVALAESFEHDANFWRSIEDNEDREDHIRSTSTIALLETYVDTLQTQGRYTFTLKDATDAIHQSASAIQQAIEQLVERARLACPEPGFHVIVPLEYRAAGAPPPTWYIDEWMRWAQEPYYVGLLSAAAIHGAARQQPLVFQVVVAHDRRAVTVGRSRIQFISSTNIERALTIKANTDTGVMHVATPEMTAFDLVAHSDLVDVDTAATILAELGEVLDADRLVEASSRHDLAVTQRLGWLLERVDFADRVEKLFAFAAPRNLRASPLRPGSSFDRAPSNRWQIAPGAGVEVET